MRWTMITSRSIAHGLYSCVWAHDLIQKVCNFLGSCSKHQCGNLSQTTGTHGTPPPFVAIYFAQPWRQALAGRGFAFGLGGGAFVPRWAQWFRQIDAP